MPSSSRDGKETVYPGAGTPAVDQPRISPADSWPTTAGVETNRAATPETPAAAQREPEPERIRVKKKRKPSKKAAAKRALKKVGYGLLAAAALAGLVTLIVLIFIEF